MATANCPIDAFMEAASQALAHMDYGVCEQRCLEALAMARSSTDWSYYGRILLPLLEARRQRRMIAAEGVIRLGSADLQGDPVAWLGKVNPGCIVLTHPHDRRTARQIDAIVLRNRRFNVQLLLADQHTQVGRWTLKSFGDGPNVSCAMPAPPGAWIDRWIPPKGTSNTQPGGERARDAAGSADWFLDACERLGDTALAQIAEPPGHPGRIQMLERCLHVVADHEKLHQALIDEARMLAQADVSSI